MWSGGRRGGGSRATTTLPLRVCASQREGVEISELLKYNGLSTFETFLRKAYKIPKATTSQIMISSDFKLSAEFLLKKIRCLRDSYFGHWKNVSETAYRNLVNFSTNNWRVFTTWCFCNSIFSNMDQIWRPRIDNPSPLRLTYVPTLLACPKQLFEKNVLRDWAPIPIKLFVINST